MDSDTQHARFTAAPSIDVWDGQAARSLTIQILTGRPVLFAAGLCLARYRLETTVFAIHTADTEALRPVGFRRLRLTGRCTLAPPAGR